MPRMTHQDFKKTKGRLETNHVAPSMTNQDFVESEDQDTHIDNNNCSSLPNIGDEDCEDNDVKINNAPTGGQVKQEVSSDGDNESDLLGISSPTLKMECVSETSDDNNSCIHESLEIVKGEAVSGNADPVGTQGSKCNDNQDDVDNRGPTDDVLGTQGRKKQTMSSRKKMKYDIRVMEQAVQAVRSRTMGLRKAAKHYSIAISTLMDKVKGKTAIKCLPRTLLTPQEEEKLFEWVLRLAGVGFRQTTDDIRSKVKAILDLRGKGDCAMPSPAWVYRFFSRHPDLTLRTPISLGKERALVTPTSLKKWFAGLESHINKVDPSLLTDPSRIFNADESGFSFDPKHRKVIAWKGVKTVYNITASAKTQVTVLATMNASGLYLPPLFIYPYERVPCKNLMDGFPDALLQVSDNGWVTAAIFHSWLRDSFIPATKHLKKPLLLLVDGHTSHTSLMATSVICKENGIILYCLLAHASHLIQPLDQAFFRSIKSEWSLASRRHIKATEDAIGLDTFAKVFQPVWQKCATHENAASSYRAAGIFPFLPERVLHFKKMNPCQVFHPEQPIQDDQPQEPVAAIKDLNPIPPHVSNPGTSLSSHDLDPILQYDLNLGTSLFLQDSDPIPPYDSNQGTILPPQESDPIPPYDSNPGTSLPPQDSNPIPPYDSNPGTSLSPQDSDSIPRDSNPSSKNPDPEFSAKQLEAMKDFALFITEELGRNGFLRCFNALSQDGTTSQQGFNEFKVLASSLKSSFEKEHPVVHSRAPPTLENKLKIPNFSEKGKERRKNPKTTPTLHYVIGEDEHREAIKLREEAKAKEEKAKLARKTMGEENVRKRKEAREELKLRRNAVKEKRQQRLRRNNRRKKIL